jgi:hypothetical protein
MLCGVGAENLFFLELFLPLPDLAALDLVVWVLLPPLALAGVFFELAEVFGFLLAVAGAWAVA